MKKQKIFALFLIITLIISGLVPNGNSIISAKTKYSEKVTLYVGQTTSLYYTINFKKINSKKVKWKSYNKKIATVSKKGVVKAKKKGKTKIRAKYGKKVLYAKVTVKARTESNVNNTGASSANATDTTNASNANVLTNTQLAANLLINMQPLIDGSILFSVTNNNSQMVTGYTINYQIKNTSGIVVDTGSTGGYVIQPGQTQYCYEYVGRDKIESIDINQSVCSVTVSNYNYTDETPNVSVTYQNTSDNNIAFTYYNGSIKTVSIKSIILFYDVAGQLIDVESSSAYLSSGETKFTTVYTPYEYDDDLNHIPSYASYQVFYYAY